MGDISTEFPIVELTTAAEVQEYFDFANPILLVDQADQFMLEHYTPEHIERLIAEGRRVLFIIRHRGEIVAGAMAKVYDDVDRTLRMIEDPGPHVGVEYAAVHEGFRRRGLQTRLYRQRFAWARQRGVKEIVTEIELTNLPSLRSAFKLGFVATNLLPPSLGIPADFLILRKVLHASEF